MLNIVHISDLHYTEAVTSKKDVSMMAVESIKSQIAQLVAERVIDPNPILVFTGDLVYNGAIKEDFVGLNENLLSPLTKLLGISKSRVFLSPGNHDMDMNAIPEKDWIIGETFYKDCDLDKLDNDLRKKLHNYFEFIDETGYSSVTNASPRIINYPIDGRNIVIWNGLAGCYARSAISEKDSNDRGKLFFVNTEVTRMRDCLFGKDILVTHHPLAWYFDQSARKLRNELISDRVLMTGHLHDAETIRSESENGFIQCVAGGVNGAGPTSDTSLSIVWVAESNAVRIRQYSYQAKTSSFNEPVPSSDTVLPESARGYFDRNGCSFSTKALRDIRNKAKLKSERDLRSALNAVGEPSFVQPDLSSAKARASENRKISVEEIAGNKNNCYISGEEISGKSSLLFKICEVGNQGTYGKVFLYLNYRAIKFTHECFEKEIRRELKEIEPDFNSFYFYAQKGMLSIVLDDYTGIESKKLSALKDFIEKYPNIHFVFSNAGGASFSEAMQPSEMAGIKLDYFSLDRITANTVRQIIATISEPLSYAEQTKLIGRVFKSIHHLQAPRTIFYVQNFVDLFVNEGGIEPLNKYLLVSNLLSAQMRQAWSQVFPDDLYDKYKVEAYIGFLVYNLHNDGKVIFSKDYFYEIASRYKADIGFKFDSDEYFKFIRLSKLLSRYGDDYAFSIPSFEHYFLS